MNIVLDKFSLRWYQEPVYRAIEEEGCRRVLLLAARRSGKDILGWNLAIRQCIKRKCLVLYVLPTFNQARRCIWDAIAVDGTKFQDYIPKDLIDRINHSEMKITFTNGSILQCIGGDSYDTSLVGTNPYAIILSEYALMSPEVFDFARPILAGNGGWCLICTTPRGKNHLWHMFKAVKNNPEWKIVVQKASEIQHIPAEVLALEKAEMDPGLYEQEYEVSFERGIQGAYYGAQLDQLRLKGQIGPVPWENSLVVYTAWDIGVNDATSIIFFQVVGSGQCIRIIDYYSNTGLGIDHYAKIIQDKPYRYASHFGPFDLKCREWGGGAVTRYEKAHQLGIEFVLLDQIPLQDGIENCWTHFPKMWIDQEKCRSLLDCLENYRREWDEKKALYINKPIHNFSSHGADAFRYLCQSLHKTERGMTAEEFNRIRDRALYGGGRSDLPRAFQNSSPWDNYRR